MAASGRQKVAKIELSHLGSVALKCVRRLLRRQIHRKKECPCEARGLTEGKAHSSYSFLHEYKSRNSGIPVLWTFLDSSTDMIPSVFVRKFIPLEILLSNVGSP